MPEKMREEIFLQKENSPVDPFQVLTSSQQQGCVRRGEQGKEPQCAEGAVGLIGSSSGEEHVASPQADVLGS